MKGRFFVSGAVALFLLQPTLVVAADLSAAGQSVDGEKPMDSASPEGKPPNTSIEPGSQASTAPESAPAQVEEIVVTAQKRGEAINSIPMAISAFKGEELKQQGIVDTRDLGKVVPGFTAADSGFNTPVYTLRGVGFADSSFAATSTVGIYADEVSLTYPIMSKGPNLDLKRVEVLKGPQGTLYGRNSTGGTINYIANTPTRAFTAGAEASYGSFDRTDIDGYVSGPLTETLSGRLAATTIKSENGWQISNTRPDDRLGKLDRQAARGILDWDPRDDVLVRLTVSGWQDRSDPQAPFAVALQPQNPFFGNAGLDRSVASYPIIPDNRDARIADWNPNASYGLNDKFWMASLRPSWDIKDDVNLTGVFSYQKVRADGSSFPQGGLNVEDIDQVLFADIRSLSGELRLSGNAGTSVDWLIGANSSYDRQHEIIEGHASENSLNIGLFGDTPPLYKPIFFEKGAAKGDATVHTNSIFADGSWQFLDTLKLTLGARYTKENQKYSGCTYVSEDNDSIFPFPYFTLASLLKHGVPLPTLANLLSLRNYLQGLNPIVNQGECGSLDASGKAGLFTGKLPEHNFSYRSVLSWTPTDDVLVYGSYSRGFKSGSFPTIFSVDQASLAPVVQEKLDAYELGTKITTLDRTLHVNFAGFYYDYRNKQLLTYFKDPIFGPLQYLQNVPKSRDAGVELSAVYTPVRNLHLAAVGSYVRTKVIEFTGLTSQGTSFDFAGQEFNYTPRKQASLLADYSFTLGSNFYLTPGAAYTYTSATNSTLEHDPLFALNAHRILDLRLSLSSQDNVWSLTAYGHNVTDEFYRNSVIKLGDSVFAYAGQPKTFGLSLSYNFR